MFEDKLCQRLEPLFLGDCRTCAALWTVGTVYVVKLGYRYGIVDCLAKLGSELSLFVDKSLDFGSFFINIAKIYKAVIKITQNFVRKLACRFLSVTCDKRNGIALINKLYCVLYLKFFQGKFLQEDFFYIVHVLYLISKKLLILYNKSDDISRKKLLQVHMHARMEIAECGRRDFFVIFKEVYHCGRVGKLGYCSNLLYGIIGVYE